MRHITEEQAKEMRQTVSERSASYVEFASHVAYVIGDVIAYDIYTQELHRRIDAECGTYQIDPLDAIPTWEAVNPNT
jgi:hypothetical protein